MLAGEQWQKVQELFHAVLERDPPDRALFLDEVCGENTVLRAEVATLLSAHETGAHFIDEPAYVVAADVMTDDHEFKSGEMLGRYRILSVLGQGGMGKVYLADDTKLKRKVALKVLPRVSWNPETHSRLLREAQAAAGLDHPNICAIYEVDEAGDHSYIAMQFVEGETLESRMLREKLSLTASLNVASQVADALIEAHANRIIHRDIKPSNIMVTDRGRVKVLDFGVAKTTSASFEGLDNVDSRSMTTPGMILGTVPYMSPQQLRGEAVDARSDIFSFGVVVYEMLSGRSVFARSTDAETIGAILHEEPPSLSTFDATIPKRLEDIVFKCLAKKLDERYQTIQEVADDLSVALTLEKPQPNQSQTDHTNHLQLTEARIAPTTSNVGRRIGKLKPQRLSAMLVVACVAIVATAFAYYSFFVRSVETIDSVAVLPFINVGNDPNGEYLSDGISDSIINSLSQLPNIKKLSSFSSVIRYKGKEIDPQVVGRELNVRGLLTGRLTLRGDEVLVTTELVDVKNNKRLWGRQYSHKLSDVHKLQSEIAQDVSENLRLKLNSEQHERLAKPNTENAEAYRLYLQGRYYLSKNTDEATLKSGEYFKQAIEKDPNFALAYVELATYYSIMANFGNMRPNDARLKSEEAAVRALAIDDRLAQAHAALALVKMWYDWDWQGAEREFKRSIELEPELVRRGTLYVRLLEVLGRFDEAIALGNKADELPPGWRGPRLPDILYSARRYDQALEEYRKQYQTEPNLSGLIHVKIGLVYVQQGKYEEALAVVRQARPAVTQPRQLAQIGYIYAAMGNKDEATKILNEVESLTGERYNLGTHVAALYAALGKKDEALAWLKKACDEHEQGVPALKIDPRFDTLRSDPRFIDLLRRIKLAP